MSLMGLVYAVLFMPTLGQEEVHHISNSICQTPKLPYGIIPELAWGDLCFCHIVVGR